MSRPTVDEPYVCRYDIVRLVDRDAYLRGLAGVRQGADVSDTPQSTMRHCIICRLRRMLPQAGWTETLEMRL